MMTIMAMAMLLSSLGLVIVLSPEPIYVMSLPDGENVLKATLKVPQGTLLNVEEMKDTLMKDMEVVTKPVEKSVSWFRRKPMPEDHLIVAKEKTILAKESIQEAGTKLKDATLEKLGSTIETTKEKAANIYHETGEKSSQAMEATKDVVRQTEEWIKDGAHHVYNKAETIRDATYDIASVTKDKVESAIQRAELRTKEVAKDVYNSAAKTFGSTKDETNEKVGGTHDTIYDAVGYMKKKLQEIVVGAKNKVYDASMTTKDKTSSALEYAKDKVYKGVGSANNAILDNVQSRLDTTKEIVVDASKKVNVIQEYAIHSMKEVGHGIVGKTKDVACKTTKCLQAQSHEAEYFLFNLGQGVGYAYNDRRADRSDIKENLKEKTTNINENVVEMGENTKTWKRNGVNGAKNPTKQFYEDVKDKIDHYYHEGEDQIGEKYDPTRDIRNYYDEEGRHYRNARNYYDRSNDYFKSKGGRQYYKGARDVPFGLYYDVTKNKNEDYYNGMKDKTRHVFKDVKDKAGDYYDNLRDRMGGYIPIRHEEGSRSYYSTTKQRAANGYRNARDITKDYYESAKFKLEKDIVAMVESMDWRRVGIVPSNHVLTSSSQEVVIGNVKYAWHGKGQHPSQETIFNRMSNTMKGATHNVGEKIGLIKEHIKEDIENVRDVGIRAKDQTYDTIRDDRLRQMGRSWVHHGSNYREYEDDNNDKDDYIVTKGTQNLKEGMQNARHSHESQQSEGEEYANLAQQDFFSSMEYGKDRKTLERGRNFLSWKEVFFKRPIGILLLLIRALHLFTFSIVYGSSFWVTFVSGIILSKHIPRQQFGYVQSRMFPIYLRILAVGQSIMFILHFIMHPWFIADSVERCQLSNFGLMIASTLINAYVLEPRGTKIMFKRLKVEKEEGRGLHNAVSPMDAKQLMEEHKKKLVGINQQFKALHNYSSALNLISLGGLTCHLWHLAHRLVI